MPSVDSTLGSEKLSLPVITDVVSAACMHKIFQCPIRHSYQIHVLEKSVLILLLQVYQWLL